MTGDKRIIRLLIAALTLSAVLFLMCGCGKSSKRSSIEDKLDKFKSKTSSASDGEGPDNDSKDNSEKDSDDKISEEKNEADYSSVDGILSYMAGDWNIYDPTADEDYGVLSVEADGSVSFTRSYDDKTVKGDIKLKYSNDDNAGVISSFELEFSDVPDGFTSYDVAGGSITDSGNFYITSFDGEDYLYLRENGNGESEIAFSAFNPDPGSFDCILMEWIFHRKSTEDKGDDPVKNDTFDGFIWKQTGDDQGLWIQPVTCHTWEAYTDYTNRHYLAGAFAPEDFPSAYYTVDHDEIEPSFLLSGERFALPECYPLLMARITTDKKGVITSIEEIDQSEYGIYDMGSLKSEYSYDGLIFTYNGADYDISEYGVANAIMGCEECGDDWIIVEGHVNPDVSQYFFFNTGRGDFVYDVSGTSLIWKDDDIYTSLYLFRNGIYDLMGSTIGYVQDGEAYDLEFSPDGYSVITTCWKVEGETESTFTEEFPLLGNIDDAMYAYGNYLLSPCAGTWKAFREAVPDSALGIIMIDPPQFISDNVYLDHGEEDRGIAENVIFAAVKDNTTVSLDDGRFDGSFNWQTTGKGTEYSLYKGWSIRYTEIVPEGEPYKSISVSADGEVADWPIAVISGEVPQHSAYVQPNLNW